MTHLISVIVPVYNAEQYVERCVNSICNQTYKNLEIILVNDGSKDTSKDICESLVAKDSRITLINQENGGSSIARNTGLKNATGNIISFVDSDDYIEHNMLETMLQLMIDHDLEVVEVERNAASDTVRFDNSFTIEDPIVTTKRIIKTTAFQVWKRIYKRSLVEGMRFIPKIIHQDVFFTIDVINKVSKIGFLNSPMYRYNRDSEGIIRSKYSEMKRDVSVRATEYLKANLIKDPSIQKELDTYIVGYYTGHFMVISRNTIFDKDKSHRKKLRKDIIKSLRFSNVNLRTLMVIILPMRLTEIVSKTLQSFRSRSY